MPPRRGQDGARVRQRPLPSPPLPFAAIRSSRGSNLFDSARLPLISVASAAFVVAISLLCLVRLVHCLSRGTSRSISGLPGFISRSRLRLTPFAAQVRALPAEMQDRSTLLQGGVPLPPLPQRRHGTLLVIVLLATAA